MTGRSDRKGKPDRFNEARRNFLRGLGLGTAAVAATPAWGGATFSDAFADFFQKQYQRMSPEEVARHAFEGVREGRFWIFPDPMYREGFQARADAILEGKNPFQALGIDADS